MPHLLRRPLLALAALCLIVGGSPALAHDDDVRIHGVAVGTQKLQALPGGAMQADYGFSERGRAADDQPQRREGRKQAAR